MIEKTQINEKEAWYGEFKIRIFQTIQIFVELFFYISSLAIIIENNCIADISCTGNFTFIWNRTYVSVCAEFVWTKLTYDICQNNSVKWLIHSTESTMFKYFFFVLSFHNILIQEWATPTSFSFVIGLFKQQNFTTTRCENWKVQYPVPGFELTNSWFRVTTRPGLNLIKSIPATLFVNCLKKTGSLPKNGFVIIVFVFLVKNQKQNKILENILTCHVLVLCLF